MQEQGLVGSKAVLKGTANLQITYLDNENALRTLSFSVPFSQYCQMEGDYDQDETLESVLLVTGVQLEPVASEQVAEAAVRRGAAGAVHGRAAAGADAL